jgi:hypothetical protein
MEHVVELYPDHRAAREALGYRLVDGIWLSPREIGQANARAAAAVVALKKWKPKFETIRREIESGNVLARKTGAERLAAVADPAAVPAMELVLCRDSERMALAGISQLGDMKCGDASLALARQALFSKWPEARKTAVKKLRNRDWETFVPALLSAMHTPIQTRVEMFRVPDGRLFYRHTFYRQGIQRDELLVIDSMFDASFNFAPYITSTTNVHDDGQRTLVFDDGTRAAITREGKVIPVGRQSKYSRQEIALVEQVGVEALRAGSPKSWTFAPADKSAANAANNQGALLGAGGHISPTQAVAKAQLRELEVARTNFLHAMQNGAICELLADLISDSRPRSPEEWTLWWVDKDDVYVPGNKTITAVYVPNDNTAVTTPIPLEGKYESPEIHFSCLTAGTPVWTEAGPIAVEKIQVGDRVLSQDPETGELNYKPVLHTTIRMSADLVKLDLMDEKITCSLGHRFWIAGQGWTKARDIEPGMNIHGAEGTTRLRSSAPAGVGSVYNLIVADFHSYFVGNAMVYSHDITVAKHTEMLAPGVARK